MLWLFLIACETPPPEYDYGVRLSTLEFQLYSRDMGVHPDKSLLSDPNNPFRWGMDGDTKWDILLADDPVATFYAFGTNLANIPTGEHQYVTALGAQVMYEQQLAADDDLVFVRDIAIRGYQTILDEFPDGVIYDGTGRVAFPLAAEAYLGIEALGGTVEGGWTLVESADGRFIAIPPGGE